ncbi:PKD domain-containing protein [Geodermatophilus sp. YIM 151500]|uniref:PKD domain-containing protein n=1 Tax=Geodermatophilus sp. YIM 151500 TaxID=2984531 RepID=UPI0021E4C978|nr:PKD domain-containing protein [Geodermatophilus sp. YIM 151500]MCV2489980.1 PKD domain-containing protein [Geodermatophilus sp. YIM 151500]
MIGSSLAGAVIASGVVVGAPGVSAAAPGDVGVEGASFTGAGGLGYSASSDKPQSKLWHVSGTWFATMFDPGSGTWNIFRLDGETWTNTGVRVDQRPDTLSDALWDGEHLYIASHVVTVQTSDTGAFGVSQPRSEPAQLRRYSYDDTTKSFSPDAGYPVRINGSSSESLSIAKDSTNRIWATWTQVAPDGAGGYVNEVYVNSGRDGGAWGTPAALGVAGAEVAPDDISAIVAFDDQVGVLWSNQVDDRIYWATHDDGASSGSWSGGVASSEPRDADDHISIKTVQSDAAGRVYATVKTSADVGGPPSAAQIKLLTFTPDTERWASATVSTVADCHTRPTVVLDETNETVHVFATGPEPGAACGFSGQAGTIYHKSAPMDALGDFQPSGRGEPVIRDFDSAGMNDPTSTKQSVTGASGLVVLANNRLTARYWHARLDLGGDTPPPTAPVAGFTTSVAQGAAPLQVGFTDTSTGEPTSWSWDFGDGTVSVEQNPVHTYTTPGEFTVTMTATNAAGTSAPTTTTVTVTQPGAPPTDPGTPPTEPGTPPSEPGSPPTGPGPAAPPTGPVDRAGSWFYLNDRNTGQANTVLEYGDAPDEVLVADTDGRNGDSLLIRRGNRYFVRNSLTSGVAEYTFDYGNRGDVVLVGDWDGDGRDTLVVRRGNTYYVKNDTTTGVADFTFVYGDPGDTVLVGDWDGDGVDTLVVRRGYQYHIRDTLSSGIADRVVGYGNPGDDVLVGRWNGRADSLAVRRGIDYYLKYELSSGVADVVFAYGNPGDEVLVGDWNGDGTDSLGVRRIG